VFGEEFAKGHAILAKSLNEERSLATSLLVSTAAHADGIVDAVKRLGTTILPVWFYTPPHMQQPKWSALPHMSSNVQVYAKWQPSKSSSTSTVVRHDDVLPRNGGIWFDAGINGSGELPAGFRVQWRVTNTGAAALAIGAGRGEFYPPMVGNTRWEALAYRGVHIVEAFIIRRSDDVLVGKSPPFHVVVE
jgi:hypothetical protein